MRALFPARKWLLFLSFPTGVGGALVLSHLSHLDGPTLMTPLKCNYSPRPHPQIPSHWVLGLQHMNILFGGAYSVHKIRQLIVSGFVSHGVSVLAPPFCCHSAKATSDNMETDEHCWVPIRPCVGTHRYKFYLIFISQNIVLPFCFYYLKMWNLFLAHSLLKKQLPARLSSQVRSCWPWL